VLFIVLPAQAVLFQELEQAVTGIVVAVVQVILVTTAADQ
jgi:hypothetical protein